MAKLLDFGLAKPLSADTCRSQLTQEGSITGSPLFMSPEQALGDSEPDARSDIYSLGAVAYFLLTGVPPFDGDKPIKIILAQRNEQVVPPSRLRPDIPGRPGAGRAALPGQEPGRSLPDVGRAAAGAGRVRGRRRLDPRATPPIGGSQWRSNGKPESLTAAALS